MNKQQKNFQSQNSENLNPLQLYLLGREEAKIAEQNNNEIPISTSTSEEKIFIDSTFIIALIDIKHIKHEQAKEIGLKYQDWNLVVTTDVLYEASQYLSDFYKSKIIVFIEDALASKKCDVVQSTQNLFSKSFARYKHNKGDRYTPNRNWTLAQCKSFIVMEEMGINKVLTFDKEFVAAGFYVLPDLFR